MIKKQFKAKRAIITLLLVRKCFLDWRFSLVMQHLHGNHEVLSLIPNNYCLPSKREKMLLAKSNSLYVMFVVINVQFYILWQYRRASYLCEVPENLILWNITPISRSLFKSLAAPFCTHTTYWKPFWSLIGELLLWCQIGYSNHTFNIILV